MARLSPKRYELSRLERILITLGGGRSKIVNKASVDATEMAGRGIAALIPALFGSLAACVAFRYALSLPLATAVAVGAGWGVVVLCFDLALMTAAPGRGFLSGLGTFGARALVSVLAAFTFASPIVLVMYAKDVGTQMAKDEQTDLATYNHTVIIPKYAGDIKADNNTITTDQDKINHANQKVAFWQQQVENAGLQATCEAGGISGQVGCQQGTGQVGEGPVYRVRISELQNAQANLANAQSQANSTQASLGQQISSAQAALSQAQQAERTDYAQARARYLNNNGLIARWRALGEIEKAHASVRAQVWLFEGLIVAIDLSALITKISSRTPSYNRLIEAERTKVTLRAAMDEEDAVDKIELKRAKRNARGEIERALLDGQVDVALAAIDAQREVALWRIRAWANQQTGNPQPAAAPYASAWSASRPRNEGAAPNNNPIQAMGLSHFVDEIRPHEQVPAPMEPSLRRAAWLGVALLAALAIALLLAHAAHAIVIGGWLVAVALAAALALALYSRGFRRGPAWAQRAAFGTGLLGLTLPLVIVLLNI